MLACELFRHEHVTVVHRDITTGDKWEKPWTGKNWAPHVIGRTCVAAHMCPRDFEVEMLGFLQQPFPMLEFQFTNDILMCYYGHANEKMWAQLLNVKAFAEPDVLEDCTARNWLLADFLAEETFKGKQLPPVPFRLKSDCCPAVTLIRSWPIIAASCPSTPDDVGDDQPPVWIELARLDKIKKPDRNKIVA